MMASPADSLALPEASSVAGQVDLLWWLMIALCGVVVVGVFSVMIVFCIRYRQGSTADRSDRPPQSLVIELTWTLVPFAMFVGIFVWSIILFAKMEQSPGGALPVYVVGKQWMWKVEHPGGQREINELHVPVGQTVNLTMTSQDVIHSFFIPAFRMKQDVLPDQYTHLWFKATETGDFEFKCAEFCGTDHSRMRGRVIVMAPAAYANWLDTHGGPSLARRGEALFRKYGCSGCHGPSASVHAPPLVDLYGSPVPLSDGTVVTADDRYIHDSIVLPNSQVAAGYAPIMPSFEGQISESDILALIAYIKSRHAQEDTPMESRPMESSHERR